MQINFIIFISGPRHSHRLEADKILYKL